MSVQLSDLDKASTTMEDVAKMPAVKAVYPITRYPMPDLKVEWVANNGKALSPASLSKRVSVRAADDDADTFSPHVMTQVDKMRAKGITGKGIKIAVVDTGTDYTHPALGNGCFGKGCLVEMGYDFVGDAYTGKGFSIPQPDNDPLDCGGHGTHVSGIIAAQAGHALNFTGNAPDVKLRSYKVFGCDGSTGTDILIAAFNKAYEDGADIITSSIGGPSGWSEDPWAVAASRIVAKGVPVTISAGNSGANGLYYASSGSSGVGVQSIASFDTALSPVPIIPAKISDGSSTFTVIISESSPPLAHVNLPLYALGTDTTVANDGCAALPDSTPDLKGKIVIVRRGGCNFSQKAQNIIAKGAEYLLVYNNDGTAPFAMALGDATLKGAAMVSADDGAKLVNGLKDGKKLTFSIDDVFPSGFDQVANKASGGALSGYTSWGPTWENDMKPNFGAVGGSVLSTYPVKKGSYAVLSGTSMACPQNAAIMALIIQARGTKDPDTIRNLLSSNANPQLFNDKTKFFDGLAPVPQQGAGLVQAYDAAFATTLLSPAGLSFNETKYWAKSKDIKLSNTGKESVTYKLSHVPALTMYSLDGSNIEISPFPNTIVDKAAATLAFSDAEVKLGPGESKTIKVSPTPPTGLDAKRLAVWSGYIAINGTDGTSLSMPYQGTTGDLHEHIALPKTNHVWWSDFTDETNNAPIANETFVLPPPGQAKDGQSLPALTHNLAMGSPKVLAHLKPMTTCPPKNMTFEFMGEKTVGMLDGFPALFVPRANSSYALTGKLSDGNYAPPGKYKVIVRVLRIGGDEKNEKDWDVAESRSIKFSYA